jgi:hypothetical protein
MTLVSGRDKTPLTAPLVPYLTRYVEAAAGQGDSNATMAFNQ